MTLTIQTLRENSLAKVLTHYGYQVKQKIKCINPEHDDTKPSMQVNLDTGRVYCHGCRWRADSIDIVRLKENINFNQAVAKVLDIMGETKIEKKVTRETATKVLADTIQNIYCHVIEFARKTPGEGIPKLAEYLGLESWDVEQVWNDEGLGYLDCKPEELVHFLIENVRISKQEAINEIMYEAGIYSEQFILEKFMTPFCQKRLLFPLIEDGVITNITARATRKDDKVRFLLFKKRAHNKPTSLWGIDRIYSSADNVPIIMVEGEGDRLAILAHRFPVIPVSVRGLGSAAKIPSKIEELNQNRNIVWLADSDPTNIGYREAVKFATSCPGVKVAQIPNNRGKDARDWLMHGCSKTEFMENIGAAAFPTELEKDVDLEKLPMPEGFRLKPDGLYMEKTGKKGESYWVKIAGQPLWLDQIGLSEDRQRYYLLVAYIDPMKNRRQITMSAGDANDFRKLREYASFGIDIRYSTTKEISEYLVAAFRQIGHKLRKVEVAEQNGWRGNPQNPFPFIYGTTTIGRDKTVPYIPTTSQNLSIAKGIDQCGNFDTWAETARLIWKGSELGRFCLMLPFAGPLIHPMLGQSFLVYLWGGPGRTSTSGKTTISLFALSMYGNPEALKQTLSGTSYGITEACAQLSDLFLVLDERQAADSSEDIRKTIYRVASGKTKLQGSAGGGLRDQRLWRITGLASGEEPMNRKHAGEYVRIIDLHAKDIWGTQVKSHREFARDVERTYRGNYGHAGKAHIENVCQILKDPKQRTELMERCQKYENQLAELTPDNHMVSRLAPSFAIIALAGEMTASMIGTDPNDAFATCRDFYLRYANSWQEADPAKAALHATLEWISSNHSKFRRDVPETQRRYGMLWTEETTMHKDYIALIPNEWERAMRDAEIDARSVRTVWRDNGWLVCDEGRITKVEWINGQPCRCLCLKQEVIAKLIKEEADGEEDSESIRKISEIFGTEPEPLPDDHPYARPKAH